MDTSQHNLNALFEQLGLPGESAEIKRFIDQNRPLSQTVHLADAPFWTRAQADFIRCAWEEDADWSEAIDELDVQLRH